MNYPENLVLSGGGPNGLLHLGALSALRTLNQLHKVRRFAGTSIGAILAACLAVGCSLEEIWADTLEFLPLILQPEFSIWSLQETRGFRSLEPIRLFLRRVFQRHLGIAEPTFAQLPQTLVVSATDLGTTHLALFGPSRTPGVNVVEAVTASAAIPVVFPPVIINGIPFIDGGCILNLPIGVLPPGPTLHLWITDQPTRSPVRSLTNLSTQVLRCFFRAQNELVAHWFRAQHHPDFLPLLGATEGFLPVPVQSVDRFWHAGVQYACRHLLRFQHPWHPRVLLLLLFNDWISRWFPLRFLTWVILQTLTRRRLELEDWLRFYQVRQVQEVA